MDKHESGFISQQSAELIPKEGLSEDMIELYQQLAPEYLQELKSAQSNSDIKAIKFQAHKLNSVMGIMGFEPISSLLKQICGCEDDPVITRPLVDEVNELTQTSLASLSAK
ncbi:MAG: Hpt domain-containing protein [Pseudomonadota bacterium]